MFFNVYSFYKYFITEKLPKCIMVFNFTQVQADT
jgi:hypothetical protein